MNSIEKAHRQKSVELEKIDIEEEDLRLSLKLLAYPIRRQVYPGKLAYVVYFEYVNDYGYFSNFKVQSGYLSRFFIDANDNINELVQQDKLLVKSISYQKIRLKLLNDAINNSLVNDTEYTSYIEDEPALLTERAA